MSNKPNQQPDAGGQPSPQRSPRRRGRRSDEPLKVRIELVVIDDPVAAEELRRQQALAVAQALQWFHDHPRSSRKPIDTAE